MFRKQSPAESFGSKVKSVVQVVGAMKGLYDAGKTVYSLAQAAQPIIQAGLSLI